MSEMTQIAERYLAVWGEADPELRRKAVAELWAVDGEELVEDVRFRGHAELTARVAEAYQEFVVGRGFTVTSAGDLAGHHDLVTLTVRLTTDAGEVAWAARAVLLLDTDGRIRRDYQMTVVPLAA